MGSIRNTVYYCCVAKGSRILYPYSGGDHEIDGLALLCLENTPPFHKWYFETTGKRTFAFLIEDGYVYFVIAHENVANPQVLEFLEHLRHEFKKGSAGSLPSVQEDLVAAIHRLIATMETVASVPYPSPTSSANMQIEIASSTKAPLLGKPSKQEKAKDEVIAIRDTGQGEPRKSADRRANTSDSVSETLDSSNPIGTDSRKDLVCTRMRSNNQSIRKKWWQQVRIVLAIDAAVCLLLLVIWLCVCEGIKCVR